MVNYQTDLTYARLCPLLPVIVSNFPNSWAAVLLFIKHQLRVRVILIFVVR